MNLHPKTSLWLFYLDILLVSMFMGVPTKASCLFGEDGCRLGTCISDSLGLHRTSTGKKNKRFKIGFKKKHLYIEAGENYLVQYLLKGDESGVVFLPTHTSSIFERTLLIKAALVITFSEAERLATVDRGWGLLTKWEKSSNWRLSKKRV